jgi:starch-binding outer membrane protein, SusD/RagB family
MKKTNKIYKHVILLLVLLISFSGCDDDFLDIKPKGQMIPETTDDYRKLLDMIVESNVGLEVTTIRTSGIANYLADDFQLGDSANYFFVNGNDLWGMYSWAEDNFLYDIDREDVDWKALYGGIYTMNSVINGVPNASGPQSDKDQLLAEAKVHRAFNFLTLVNIYAKHYSSNAASDPGVPLRLTLSLSSSLERASVEKVYEQILKDLSEAYPNLPDMPAFKHRPSKASALGLLARTYLYMGNYEQALNFANQALDISDFLYEFAQVMNANHQFGISAWFDNEMLLMKTTTSRTSGGTLYHHSYIWCSASVVESVFDTENDLRYFNKFARQVNSPNRYNYREGYNRWNGGFMYFPHVGVTIPEVLLTAAECEARIGDVGRAVQLVNRLAESRYKTGTYNALITTNRETAIQFILGERRRELWARGLRWFDLRRLNALEGANITIQRTFTNHRLAPGDRGWVMPIARLYTGQNPEISQNEGYLD